LIWFFGIDENSSKSAAGQFGIIQVTKNPLHHTRGGNKVSIFGVFCSIIEGFVPLPYYTVSPALCYTCGSSGSILLKVLYYEGVSKIYDSLCINAAMMFGLVK